GEAQLGHPLARAVKIYRSEVRHHQAGLLDDALQLYRQAFHLEPNVDRAYSSEKQQLQRLTTSGVLTNVIADFPSNLTFASDNKHEGATLSSIPDELLLRILRSLDTTTIERFATVCRKACHYLVSTHCVTRDSVYLAYKLPQIPDVDSIGAIVNSYAANYRQIYIEYLRLRLDGLYIAVCYCTYAIPLFIFQTSSDALQPVSNCREENIHLITYYRHLHFFTDGAVLSLLTNEDLSPQNIILMLKPSLRMKDFHVGRWQLDGSAVQISNLVRTFALSLPFSSRSLSLPFQMALTLHFKPLGRWNKLEIILYEAADAEGEAVPFALNYGPFWFSR
ncbi:hypothetical protein SCLCIDRAFT_94688, partial [Scleroderma citrinum Foug A]